MIGAFYILLFKTHHIICY